MGISNAFDSALSGLNAFSKQISYISEDLANTSTVGYKSLGANFQSYVTAANANTASGGVTVKPTYNNTVAGQVSTTTVGTNFAVTDGEGFIPVKVSNGSSNGTADFANSAQLYTRSGDFSVNASGYLVNGSGQYLMGQKETTTFDSSTIPNSASLGDLTAVKVDSSYLSMPAEASTTISVNNNFPASLTADTAIPTTDTSASQATSQIQFYDSLGTVQTLQVTYQKTASDTWNIVNASIPTDTAASVTLNGVTYTNGSADSDSSAQLVFGTSGSLSSVTGASTTVASGHLGLDFTVSGLSDGSTGTTAQTLSLDYGTTSSGTSQYSGTSLEVRSTSDATGHASGTYKSASVDTEGYVEFTYSNGQTAKPYRIPLATFNDPDALTRESGTTFTANNNSGSAVARWSGEGNAGTVTASATEASNVDIAGELTTMIAAQRAYSANGKVITTTDQMMQDTLSLKT